jgi:hypothetical protein
MFHYVENRENIAELIENMSVNMVLLLAGGVVHVFAQRQARPVSRRDVWSRVVVHCATTTPTTPTTPTTLDRISLRSHVTTPAKK